MYYQSKDSDHFSRQRRQVCNEIFMLLLLSWCGEVLLEFLLFSVLVSAIIEDFSLYQYLDVLEIIFWQSLFIVAVHPVTIYAEILSCADTVHIEILSKEFGIITDSYCAALFNIVQNCVLSLFIVLLWMYYSSFGFFTFICLYIWHLYESEEASFRRD